MEQKWKTHDNATDQMLNVSKDGPPVTQTWKVAIYLY